jgi:pilus assembly protein CpaC
MTLAASSEPKRPLCAECGAMDVRLVGRFAVLASNPFHHQQRDGNQLSSGVTKLAHKKEKRRCRQKGIAAAAKREKDEHDGGGIGGLMSASSNADRRNSNSGRRWLGGRRLMSRRAYFPGFAVALLALAIAATPLYGQSSARLPRSDFENEPGSFRHLTITLNKSRTIDIRGEFASAIVGAPDIADAMPLTNGRLYILGKKIGTTNVAIYDLEMRPIRVYDIEVTPDAAELQKHIWQATGARGVRVGTSNGQIVLTGEVADAVTADRAVQVAKSFTAQLVPGNEAAVINALTIKSPQQVMLKLRVLEVERSAARALGLNWFLGSKNGTRGATIGTGGPVPNPTVRPGAIGGVDGSGNPVSGAGVPIFQAAGTLAGLAGSPFGVALANIVNSGTTIDALITALETKGLIRSLAEPDLVALSGDQASFLAGGSVPVPSLQPGSAGTFAVVTPTYHDFGVQLTFVPTVLKNGLINLRLLPEVSEIDPALQLTVAGTSVPGFAVRRAQTTIELRDGQSFAIAGMLQNQNRRDVSQLPWIGSVPVLGTLFSSKSFQQNETDLVIIVTPHLVAPAVPGQQLASPLDKHLPSNDVDFFLFGEMELKKKYNEYVSRGGDIQGPYGHIIGGTK